MYEMKRGVRVEFTEAGQRRFDSFVKELRSLTMEYVRWRKAIPGEDLVEVTASDVAEVERKFHTRFRSQYVDGITAYALQIGVPVSALALLAAERFNRVDSVVAMYGLVGLSSFSIVAALSLQKLNRQRRSSDEDLEQLAVRIARRQDVDDPPVP